MKDDVVIHIVDDQDNERGALEEFVHSLGHKSASYSSAESFLRDFDPARGGCILLDVCMPDTTGFELFEKVRDQEGMLPVIITSAFADVPMAVRAFTEGAVGFLQKPHNAHELVQIINLALERDRASRRTRERYQLSVQRINSLTNRERMVMDLMVGGTTNKAIAEQLGVSIRTVEAHRASVMAKTKVESLAALVKAVLQYREYKNEK